MKIGYARVSTLDQNLDLQIDALTAAGCERIFTEHASGAKERPELQKLLSWARDGDMIIVWKLDRFGRSLQNLIEIVADLDARKINFRSLQENFDTSTAAGKLFFQLSACFAEYERNLLRERTAAGLQAARERGNVGGRRRAFTDDQQREILEFWRALPSDRRNFKALADRFGASERTLRRVIASAEQIPPAA